MVYDSNGIRFWYNSYLYTNDENEKDRLTIFELKEVKFMHPFVGLILFCAFVAIGMAIIANKKKK